MSRKPAAGKRARGKSTAAAEPDPAPAWLGELEERVHRAGERLRELAAKNARLAARVAELERSAGGAEEAAWRRERAEVKRRLGRLADGMERLLGQSD